MKTKKLSRVSPVQITPILIILGLFCQSIEVYPQMGSLSETVTVTTEFETPVSVDNTLRPEIFGTAISTYNGYTYMVWCDDNRRPWLTRVNTSTGTPESYRLDSLDDYQAKKDGHHKFSLGIDKNGYIHVAGDMHNYPHSSGDYEAYLPDRYKDKNILYWVSDNPEDISSFSFIGDSTIIMPGTGFSYGSFYNDNDMELFFLARVKSSNDGHFPGEMGLGLFAYDSDSLKWTARGDLADSVGSKGAHNKVIAWEDDGSNGTFYQKLINNLVFDRNNRMHITVQINNDQNYDNPRTLLYAFSDDGGSTFQRIDSTEIDLPMRAESGSSQATIILDDVGLNEGFTFVDPQNRPGAIINQVNNDGNKISKYGAEHRYWDPSKSQWVGGIANNTFIRGRAFSHPTSDILTIIAWGNTIHRTDNTGKAGYTFKLQDIKQFAASMDVLGLRQTGVYRLIATTNDTKLRILKVDFSPNTENGLTYLSDLSWSSYSGFEPQKDLNFDEDSIEINGVDYSKGIGVKANSSITFDLGGNYDYFLSDIGVDDNSGTGTKASLRVYLDGELAYYSGFLDDSTLNRNISLKISDVDELILEADDAGDGNTYDKLNWANARLQEGIPTWDTIPASNPPVFGNPLSYDLFDDLTAGTLLSTTTSDSIKGWDTGWKADDGLTSDLDTSYFISADNAVEHKDTIEMYRGLVDEIDMGVDNTYFICNSSDLI